MLQPVGLVAVFIRRRTPNFCRFAFCKMAFPALRQSLSLTFLLAGVSVVACGASGAADISHTCLQFLGSPLGLSSHSRYISPHFVVAGCVLLVVAGGVLLVVCALFPITILFLCFSFYTHNTPLFSPLSTSKTLVGQFFLDVLLYVRTVLFDFCS